jgi:hypothetical protein
MKNADRKLNIKELKDEVIELFNAGHEKIVLPSGADGHYSINFLKLEDAIQHLDKIEDRDRDSQMPAVFILDEQTAIKYNQGCPTFGVIEGSARQKMLDDFDKYGCE